MAMEDSTSFWIGMAAVVGSVLFFGTQFVPVKRYKSGDGIFVQFMMGVGIFFVAFVVFALRRFPPFYPLPMLGGFFWALANAAAVPLVETIGLALTLLLCNTVSCIMGWATSRFGLFGLNPAPPKSDTLNYIGLVLLIVGGIMFLFVRSKPGKPMAKMTIDNVAIFMTIDPNQPPVNQPTDTNTLAESLKKHKQVVAVIACLIAGLLFGSRTTPVMYMLDHHEEFGSHSTSALDYVFAYFFGAALTTFSEFVIYAVIKRSRPITYRRLVLPSFTCGVFWAIGMTLLFIGNDHLSQTIAYPIITVLPGGVGSLWSVFYFKEIKGTRSILVMCAALLVTLVGSALIALSKKIAL